MCDRYRNVAMHQFRNAAIQVWIQVRDAGTGGGGWDGIGAWGEVWGSLLWVSGLVFKSDFTNGMDVGISNRTGRSRAASCLVAPKIAIHGDFPLGIYHSISEIADFTP